MKILRIIARLNVGGPARHVIWLTEALSRDGYDSVLVTGSVPENEDSLEWFAEEAGVKPVQVKEMSRELSVSDFRSLFRIIRIVFREKPDIIHTHTAKAGTLGRLAGLLYRFISRKPVKLVHTYHGHVFHGYYGPLKTGVFLFIERMLARFATDRIVTISQLQKDEICGRFKVGKSSQFSVISLGLDLEGLRSTQIEENLKSSLGFSEDTFLIGFSGRLTEIKNIKLLLSSIEVLNSRKRDKVALAILGDGHLRHELEVETERLGISTSVRFLGNVKNPAEIIGAVDCVALTSINEGTPLSLLEAMAVGKAVVSTEVGGVPDILGRCISQVGRISIRENGLGVASGDTEALADAFEMLMDDPTLKKRVEANSAKFVDDNYSKDRLIADIKELYDHLTVKQA